MHKNKSLLAAYYARQLHVNRYDKKKLKMIWKKITKEGWRKKQFTNYFNSLYEPMEK